MIIPLLPAPPVRPLLCAPLPVWNNTDASLPSHFYSAYTSDGKRIQTIYGSKAHVETCRSEHLRRGYRVSDIISDLPLSDNLKFSYSWRGGREVQTLRPEYRTAARPPALAKVA